MPATHTPRLALTSAQLATAVGAELAQLLQSASVNGCIERDEAQRTVDWLLKVQQRGVPVIERVLPWLSRAAATGCIISGERVLLQQEVEPLLPLELRRSTQINRRAIIQALRSAVDTDAERGWSGPARRAPSDRFDFMVAGVSRCGRAERIRERGEALRDVQCRFQRVPDDPPERNAIRVIADGVELGLVPHEEAEWIAAALDRGCRYEAVVRYIINGGPSPIPVIGGRIILSEVSNEPTQISALHVHTPQSGGVPAADTEPLRLGIFSEESVAIFFAVIFFAAALIAWIAMQ